MESSSITSTGQFDARQSWHEYVNPDLNAFGRVFAYMRWYIDNARISIVGRLVTLMLLLILGVTLYSSMTGVSHLREVREFWNHFDVGTNSIYDLGRKLESGMGSGSLYMEVARLIANPSQERIGEVKKRVAETRKIVTAILEADPPQEREAALLSIRKKLDRIEGALPASPDREKLLALQQLVFSESEETGGYIRTITGGLSNDLAEGGRKVGNTLDEMAGSILTEIMINGFLLVLLAVFFFWFSGSRLSRPLNDLRGTMQALARGEKRIDIPYMQKADEIGEMSRTVAVFKENALELDRMMDEQKDKAETERQRSGKIMSLTDAFEGDIDGVVRSVAGAAQTLAALSEELLQHVSEQERDTESAAEAASGSVEKAAMVSAAASQLSSSINEIAMRIGDSMQVAGEAVKEAQVARKVMEELSSASGRIEQVTGLINEIAERINLLALNATIEAQRAGEAGRGFAVVAGEVKNLSLQTAEATSEVSEQVETIKKISHNAGSSISRVGEVIEKINLYSTEISSAITEQQSSTEEISRSIELLAREADLVKGVIVKVVDTGKKTAQASSKLQDASQTLSGNSGDLSEQVAQFLKNIRQE